MIPPLQSTPHNPLRRCSSALPPVRRRSLPIPIHRAAVQAAPFLLASFLKQRTVHRINKPSPPHLFSQDALLSSPRRRCSSGVNLCRRAQPATFLAVAALPSCRRCNHTKTEAAQPRSAQPRPSLPWTRAQPVLPLPCLLLAIAAAITTCPAVLFCFDEKKKKIVLN